MTNKDIRTKLDEKFRTVSLSKGTWTVKESYYWGMFKPGDHLFPLVQEMFPTARLVQYGNHSHGFVGGAKSGSAQDSYFWAKFTFPKE